VIELELGYAACCGVVTEVAIDLRALKGELAEAARRQWLRNGHQVDEVGGRPAVRSLNARTDHQRGVPGRGQDANAIERERRVVGTAVAARHGGSRVG
jgi:hypothetical protein